jgi:hypothetical protein
MYTYSFWYFSVRYDPWHVIFDQLRQVTKQTVKTQYQNYTDIRYLKKISIRVQMHCHPYKQDNKGDFLLKCHN